MKERVGVYIGRFQPFHNGHIDAVKQILEYCDRVIILVGSSHCSLDPHNPFNFSERQKVISQSIYASIEKGQERLLGVFPMRDYSTNLDWQKSVRTTVRAVTTEETEIRICGFKKDSSSFYLDMFPDWNLIELNNYKAINATDIRKALFEEEKVTKEMLPDIAAKFMEEWVTSTKFSRLKKEYEFYKSYRAPYEALPERPMFVTVDGVIFDDKGHVYMIKRKNYPGKGYWSLPGGFLGQNETLEESVIRTIEKKTTMKLDKGLIYKEKVIDDPKRSLRGRTVTHAFLFKLPRNFSYLKNSPDAMWFNVNQLFLYEEEIFEDHKRIIESFAS